MVGSNGTGAGDGEYGSTAVTITVAGRDTSTDMMLSWIYGGEADEDVLEDEHLRRKHGETRGYQ
jgi:hypothetical protein